MLSGTQCLELLGIFFLTFVQEDSATVTGALLAYHSVFQYWQTLGACLLGMWVSDFLIYLLGRLGGLKLFKFRWMRRIIAERQVEKASRWFDRFGWTALVFSRAIPGSRTALLFSSGLLMYPARKFVFVSFFGALGWLTVIFALFAYLGLAATAIIGSRWIISLILLACGGTAAVLFARRRRFKEDRVQDPLAEKTD
jgi:membrane protein DedA with SNARE-associated domain